MTDYNDLHGIRQQLDQMIEHGGDSVVQLKNTKLDTISNAGPDKPPRSYQLCPPPPTTLGDCIASPLNEFTI